MLRKSEKAPSPWLYLFGTLIWTWSLMGIVSVSGHHYLDFPYSLLMLIGGLGPMILALILIALGKWDETTDSSPLHFLKRSFNPRTAGRRGILRILLLLSGFVLLPLLFDPAALSTQGIFQKGPLEFLIIGFLFGAMEEIGWRGYAQEACTKRMPPAAASLVIGIFWALWHLPLFFIEGTYQASLGAGSQAFWLFMVTVIFTSPLYGWLYHQCGKSVFAPLLFHGLGNAAFELTADPSPAVSSAVHIGITFLVIVIYWNTMGPAGGSPKHKTSGQEHR